MRMSRLSPQMAAVNCPGWAGVASPPQRSRAADELTIPSPPRPAPSVRLPLDLQLEPERAALLVREDARPFALIGSWAGGGALVGSEPIRVAAPEEDPFTLLDEQPR